MTTEEMIVEVFEALGEPSDLFPYTSGTVVVDMTTVGAIKILKWLNRGYKRILNWKFPNGHQVRFPVQQGEIFFSTVVKSGTVASATPTEVTLDGGVMANDDQYNGWIVEILAGTGQGQVKVIVDFTAARVATLADAWDTVPDGTSTYALYKRSYSFRGAAAVDVSENIPLNPIDQIASVLKITDVEGVMDLAVGGGIEGFSSGLLSHGTPSSYILLGNRIVFDVAADEVIWYRMEYSKVPEELALALDEPELPETFHEALILYAQWIGLRRSQEWGGAYSTKKDIEDLMQTLKTSIEMSYERMDIGASY
jgi:hypothetical protein